MKALLLLLALAPLFARAESGPGNGTDYVKVLFAEAQFELNRALVPVESVEAFSLSAEAKAWLAPRFTQLKTAVRTMELRFQQAPCSDGSGKPASICFFTDDGDYVLISLEENKHTTRAQAMAMLLHEAGHFVGEADHLLLDRVGVELAQALAEPRLLLAEASSTEIVANIFEAKESCDNGTSLLAQRLRKEALLGLQRQCAERNAHCDLDRADFHYHGAQEFRDGRGFSMKVTCSVKAVWRKE